METGSVNQFQFIEERLIKQNKDLIEAGFWFVSFTTMSQAIETLGAFIDKKPFKAPRQSKQRFALALQELFPPRYAKLNQTDFLFRQLRSNLTHLAVASPFLDLVSQSDSNERHLSIKNKRTVLVAEALFADFEKACREVQRRLDAGELKSKILVDSAAK